MFRHSQLIAVTALGLAPLTAHGGDEAWAGEWIFTETDKKEMQGQTVELSEEWVMAQRPEGRQNKDPVKRDLFDREAQVVVFFPPEDAPGPDDPLFLELKGGGKAVLKSGNVIATLERP